MLEPTGPGAGQRPAAAWHGGDEGNADAARLAQRILTDADQQAAEIRLEAQAQAAAIREDAERQVDALRSAVRTMSADLDAYLTEKLTGPIERVTGAATLAGAPGGPPLSGAAPGTHRLAVPGTEAASPAAPATTPAAPGTRPARPAGPARQAEPPAKPRQHRAMRIYASTIAALVALALSIGAYQLATRGYTFFVFRSAGTGATDNDAVFPGIIPTPKPAPAHHRPDKGTAQGRTKAEAHRHGKGAARGARRAHRHHLHPRGNRRVKAPKARS